MPIGLLQNTDVASHADIEHLCLADRTYQLQMELTTYCNLRCIYCSTISPAHKKLNLDLGNFAKYMDEMQRRKLKTISLCGAGELTLLDKWVDYCNDIMRRGIELQVTSNLARELRDDEAETLSRCSYVNVSVDSVDPKMYRDLRKGGDLRALLYNMAKIRSRAFARRQLPPTFAWYTVVADRNVFQLKDLINFGLSFGIRTFHFCNFAKHDLEESKDLYPISMMPEAELRKLPEFLAEVYKMINEGGGWVLADAGLVDGVKERIAAIDKARAEGRPIDTAPAPSVCCGGGKCESEAKNGEAAKAAEPPPAAPMASVAVSGRASAPTYAKLATGGEMTRDCILPWSYAQVLADGNVKPCCIIPTVGKLESDKPLSSVLNNEFMRNIRKGLLTGQPYAECFGCPQVGLIHKDELRKKVEAFVNGGDLPTFQQRQEYVDMQYDPLQLRTEYERVLGENRRLEKQYLDIDHSYRNFLGSPVRLGKRVITATLAKAAALFKAKPQTAELPKDGPPRT